jgi:hypothetical protein
MLSRMEQPPPIRFELRRGAVTALPLGIAVGLFGVSFGVLSAGTGGLGALPAIVMSASTFAGSAQFAAASILAGGGSAPAAIAAALLLNTRYLPIGVSVARFLPGGPVRRFAEAQLVVDESWAIASRGEGRFDPQRLVGAGIVLWLAWVGGTIVGVAGGEPARDRRRAAGCGNRPGPGAVHAGRRPDHRRGDRRAHRPGAAVSEAWVIVLAVGFGTMAIKASGPVLLGDRPLPSSVHRVVALLAPALLAALVATAAFASDQQLTLDARAAGLAVAAVAIALRAPALLVVIAAAATAALIRLFGGA